MTAGEKAGFLSSFFRRGKKPLDERLKEFDKEKVEETDIEVGEEQLKPSSSILGLLLTGGIMVTVGVITLAIIGQVLNEVRVGMGDSEPGKSIVGNATPVMGINATPVMGIIGTVVALTVVLFIMITFLFRQFSGSSYDLDDDEEESEEEDDDGQP